MRKRAGTIVKMIKSLKPTLFNDLIDAISMNGYAICDDFLPVNIIAALRFEAANHYQIGKMAIAKTGSLNNMHQSSIRGDSIFWLEETNVNVSIQAYFQQMLALKQALNQALFMNLLELETHFAVYPTGSSYKKHLDQFNAGENKLNQARQLSSILYLNDNWQADDGGELRIYLNDDKYEDILPSAGKLVLFLSAKFWHEVLPAKRDRISLTGWFRTRSSLML